MGGRKARLMYEGVLLAVHHARRLRAWGFSPVVVAHPDDEASIEGEARVVVSTEPDQAGSLALGVHALRADTEVVLITPVDALPPSEATVDHMLAALSPSIEAVTPTFNGHGGHPVLVRRRVLDVYDRERPPLRDVLAALGEKRLLLETDDPNVVTDLDDPARVFAATGEEPRFG